jgi:hypothetical protein
MTWLERTGTGLGKPSLVRQDPVHHLGRAGEEPSYKETKERETGRVADGVVVPVKPRKAGWREGLLLEVSF